MFFEFWLKEKGYDPKKLKRSEGRKLYEEWKKEMVPVIRDCSDFLNAAYKNAES